MNHTDLVGRICASPRNYAWFLGAGASRTAGLPTAMDVIWDLKRHYYCRNENQDVARQDLHNSAVRDRIQSYCDACGFPPQWTDDEYTAYFERIFGEDKEGQRQYLKRTLGEQHTSLGVGNRVFGALMAAGLARVAFTTNFDTVVEKAVAEMGHRSLSPYHLEGAHAANTALNNEEYPLYCKLHGDFRYDSLKNLARDLQQQNEALSDCLVNAANRFGFVVAGYSGRDDSVMRLFHRALESTNPFPHGLYWTVMKGTATPPAVSRLIDHATALRVDAHIAETQTFDAFLLHLWRNIEQKPPDLDAKVRKSRPATVDIPLPPPSRQGPLLRLTGLPILSVPERCHALTFTAPKEWHDLREAAAATNGRVILTRSDACWAWGSRERLREAFGAELESIAVAQLPTHLRGARHIKGFLARALSLSLVRGRPLLTRNRGYSAYVIADRKAPNHPDLAPLSRIVRRTDGTVPGLATAPTPEHPNAEEVRWAEALRITVDERNGQLWMLVHPDLWIWPPRARRDAQDFMAERRRDRYNRKYNDLLDAWLRVVVLGDRPGPAKIELSPFDDGDDVENPRFVLSSRTAFARRAQR